MPDIHLEDTIAAIATPIGEGGISVIRVSGPQSFQIAAGVIRLRKNTDWQALLSHTIHLGEIGNQEGILLDQVVMSLFRAPHSYTGEDVIEISSHGGLAVTRHILERLIRKGARHAEPGEFTKRAFLNGKMDLTQAEAVLDLIKAKSEKSIEVAVRQLTGALSLRFRALKDELMELYAHMEAYIDFPDQDIEVYESEEMKAKFGSLEAEIERLVVSFKRGSLLREGISVVIAGKPNVGKSSLFNALLERDRALVSEYPGTTRDHLEEAVEIQGVYFRLTDTAGLGFSSEHPVDRLGMERTRQALGHADLYLYVLDGSKELDSNDRAVFSELKPGKPFLILANKSDLGCGLSSEQVEQLTGQSRYLRISTQTREGLESLEQSMMECAGLGKKDQEGEQITRLRHKQALEQSLEALRASRKAFEAQQSMELITVDLKAALDQLRELIGEIYSEDLLDVIFAEFCIGK